MAKQGHCAYCQQQTRIVAKGYCNTCYARYRRHGKPDLIVRENSDCTECSHCGSTKRPFAKRLCMACYQRQWKNGDLEPKAIRLCEVPNCDDRAVTHGLCDKHRTRLRRYGDVEATKRSKDWGAKGSHHLYERWCSMRRLAKGTQGLDPSWDDFWKFVSDVGEPPTPRYRLYRKDEAQPYGPLNFEWRSAVLDEELRSDATREERATYMRSYYAKRPHVMKNHYLRRHYGISLEQFNEMHAEQGGVCAICARPEIARHARTGEARHLAVDHDHATGAVRGLLCHGCNTGLGGFADSEDLLLKAIAYLRKHRKTEEAA